MDVKLTVARGGSKGKTLELRHSETVIGRARGCDIRIPSAAISRRHCRLSYADGYLTVEDLGSANGTYVNGAKVKKQPIRPEDELDLGPVAFVVKYHLTQKAEKKLRAAGVERAEVVEAVDVEAVDVVDVEEVEEIPVIDVEAVEVDTAETNKNKVTKKDKPSAKPAEKKTRSASSKKKEPEEPEPEEEDVPVVLDDDSWQSDSDGNDGNVRNILSELQ